MRIDNMVVEYSLYFCRLPQEIYDDNTSDKGLTMLGATAQLQVATLCSFTVIGKRCLQHSGGRIKKTK